MNQDKVYSTIIIGESIATVLITHKLLESNKFKLLAIVSDNNKLKSILNLNGIPVLKYQQFHNTPIFCDYLFSVVNHHIIPESLIKKYVRFFAINYHDSLLPKYAGLNSTTWALIENESSHGITWHEICNEIDAGDIFYQHKFSIEKNDTAFSLNIKCIDLCLSSFDELIKCIISGNIFIKKQNSIKRSYFGKQHLPKNIGIINHTFSYNEIDRLSRALHFGVNSLNHVTTLKISISGYIIIISKFTLEKFNGLMNSSTCSLTKNCLKIVHNNWVLKLYEIRSIFGYPVEIIDLKPCIPIKFDNHIVNNSEYITNVHKNEKRSLITPTFNNETNNVSRILSSINMLSYIVERIVKIKKIKDEYVKIKFYKDCNPQDSLLITRKIIHYNLDDINIKLCELFNEDFKIIHKDQEYRLHQQKKDEIKIYFLATKNNLEPFRQSMLKRSFDLILLGCPEK